MNAKIVLILFLLALIPTKRIDVVIFHSQTCPACIDMLEFLEKAADRYPTMVIQAYDIREEENKRLYDLFSTVYNVDLRGYPVPVIFIGKDSFRGYSEINKQLIDKKLSGCMKETCTIAITVERDAIVIVDPTPTPQAVTTFILLPFLVLAGIFTAANPYHAEAVSKMEKTLKSALFYLSSFLMSMLLCFALFSVLSLVNVDERVVIAFAVGMGILSLVSLKVRYPGMNVSGDHASLSVSTFLYSLLYTAGVYALVVDNTLFFAFTERVITFTVLSAVFSLVLLLLSFVTVERKGIFAVVAGVGSICLGLLSVVI